MEEESPPALKLAPSILSQFCPLRSLIASVTLLVKASKDWPTSAKTPSLGSALLARICLLHSIRFPPSSSSSAAVSEAVHACVSLPSLRPLNGASLLYHFDSFSSSRISIVSGRDHGITGSRGGENLVAITCVRDVVRLRTCRRANISDVLYVE